MAALCCYRAKLLTLRVCVFTCHSEFRALRREKRMLQLKLKTYEDEFQRLTGRKVRCLRACSLRLWQQGLNHACTLLLWCLLSLRSGITRTLGLWRPSTNATRKSRH